MLRPDGSVLWLEKRARAFFDEQGKLQRMIGMVADITERKRTEEALLEVNRTLEAQTALTAITGGTAKNLRQERTSGSGDARP